MVTLRSDEPDISSRMVGPMISDDAANAEYRRQVSLNPEGKSLGTFIADIVMGMVLTMSIAIVEWFFGVIVFVAMLIQPQNTSQSAWYFFWVVMLGAAPVIVSLIGINKARRGLVLGALIWSVAVVLLLCRISWR